MAKTLTGSIAASLTWSMSKTDEVATTREQKTIAGNVNLTNGTGANQANLVYRDEVTLTSQAPNVDIDLQDVLEDVFGDVAEFHSVKALFVKNLSAVDNDNVKVGPNSVTNGFSTPFGNDNDAYLVVAPAGTILLSNPRGGYKIQTNKHILRLKYAGVSASIKVQIAVVGVSGEQESSSSVSSSSQRISSSSTSESSSSVS